MEHSQNALPLRCSIRSPPHASGDDVEDVGIAVAIFAIKGAGCDRSVPEAGVTNNKDQTSAAWPKNLSASSSCASRKAPTSSPGKEDPISTHVYCQSCPENSALLVPFSQLSQPVRRNALIMSNAPFAVDDVLGLVGSPGDRSFPEAASYEWRAEPGLRPPLQTDCVVGRCP